MSWTAQNGMRRVILESPYETLYAGEVIRNIDYARRCVRDSVMRGEAPIASHLLYTQPQILRDEIPEERELGIAAGLAWVAFADAMVVYTDRGISGGMDAAIRVAHRVGLPVERRSIEDVAVPADVGDGDITT